MGQTDVSPHDAAAMLDRIEAWVNALKHAIGAADKVVARGRSTGWKTRLTRITAEVWSIAKDLPSAGSRLDHSQVNGAAAMAVVLSHYEAARSCLGTGDNRGALAAYARGMNELLVILGTWRGVLGDGARTPDTDGG